METLYAVFEHESTSPAIIIPSSAPHPVTVSYKDFYRVVQSFQRQLTGALPTSAYGRDKTISVSLPNSLEFATCFLGVNLLGCCAAPLNPNYRQEEFKFYIEDAKSTAIIVPKGSVSNGYAAVKAAEHFGTTVIEVAWDPKRSEVVLEVVAGQTANSKPIDNQHIKPEQEDVALLLHTSGTTGRPKGVPLTHRNIYTTMRNIINTYKLTPEDRTLLVMPLFHVHGLVCGLLATLLSGGTAVIPEKFSAGTFWKDFEEGQCNWYTAVPTIHQILLVKPPHRIPKIRFIRSCSSSLAPATFHQLEKTFKAPVLEAYAMTEAAHQMTSNPLPPATRKPGSVGLGQGVQVTILDAKGDRVEEGEVCIKGNNVTKGYLNNPKANDEAFTKDGWFRTGDQGRLDKDGYLVLTGRIKELINRGGEKISPLEVDGVLLNHPDVAEAVSFAVPDEKYGQEVHAAVVLKEEAKSKDAEQVKKDIQQFCNEKMASFKVPKVVYITDAMPKTATGKIQRRAMVDAFFKPKSKL